MLRDDSQRCLGCMSPLAESDVVCSHCGYFGNSGYDAQYLRPGTTLHGGRYLVGKLSRKNGGGATYIGFDYQDQKPCWIREYFPRPLARRNQKNGAVSPLAGNEAQYKALISDFVDVCNEVKQLAVTENVIPIINSFGEKNTVYAIYQHMNVISFDEFLAKNGGKLTLGKALEIFLPFCNMISNIHDRGHIHRGISPYTVYVGEDGTLYLGAFSLGAARTANSELEAELFNGYSAPEQYSPSGWQGNWTDIYALAALFYRTVSGFVPPKSTLIGEDRPLATLDDLVMDMPKNISDAISEAMELSTEKRTQAVYLLTSKIIEQGDSSTAIYDTGKTKRRVPQDEREKDGGFKYAILALVFTVFVLLGGLLYVMNTYFPHMMNNDSKPPESHSLSDTDSQPEGEPESGSGSEQTRVPRFVGQMSTVVQSDNEYSKLFDFSVEEEFNDEFPEGVVFKQSPEEDTRMSNRGTVILYVSKGAELVQMPNVVGLSFAEAQSILEEKSLPFDKVERYADGAVAGSVVGTSPAPGTMINPKKDSVTVFVMAAGPVTQDTPSASESGGESASSRSSSSSKDE